MRGGKGASSSSSSSLSSSSSRSASESASESAISVFATLRGRGGVGVEAAVNSDKTCAVGDCVDCVRCCGRKGLESGMRESGESCVIAWVEI